MTNQILWLIIAVSLVIWMALIQSDWFFFDCPLRINFLSQNLGLFKIFLNEVLTPWQISRSWWSKFKRIFSARCWRPGLLTMISIVKLEVNGFASIVIERIFFGYWILPIYKQFCVVQANYILHKIRCGKKFSVMISQYSHINRNVIG